MYIAANDQVKTYKGIDFFKFIFALLIVYMHTYCFDGGPVGEWIKGVLSAVGVPFFFIASGFFFGKGLKKTDVPKEYLRRYILRGMRQRRKSSSVCRIFLHRTAFMRK